MAKKSKKQVYFPRFNGAMKRMFQQQPEMKHLEAMFFDNEREKQIVARRFEPAAKRVMKGRKKFVDEAFTIDDENKLMFIYVRKDSKQILRDLLEWRGSKLKFDPMFLPVYLDQGIDEILWVGVSVSKNLIEVESAWDDTEKVAKMKIVAGGPEDLDVKLEFDE